MAFVKQSGMVRRLSLCFVLLLALGSNAWSDSDAAGSAEEDGAHVALLTLHGAIGPATADYLMRTITKAHQQGAKLAVVQLDTPGGLNTSTRDIVQFILDAPLPVVTYVYPAGARAASAGTYLLYASHVAAMTPATTLGAATPVSMGGSPGQREQPQTPTSDESSPDTPNDDSSSAMERKVVNDAVAFIRALAERHGRNAEFAERAVREAATLTANEALQQQVVDVVAPDVATLLVALDGREVLTKAGQVTLQTDAVSVVAYEPDWRNELLALITQPQVAYILLMIGIYGLLFEGYSPGALVPGVVGIICLLVGLYALQLLPVNYAGLALIVAGAALLIGEAFAPSFGILGIGGVVATVLGSLMLVDTDVPGLMISRELIGGMALALSALMLLLIMTLGKTLRQRKQSIRHELEGDTAVVVTADGHQGQVRVRGELWQARSDAVLAPGDRVRILTQHGLHLTVALTGGTATTPTPANQQGD